MISKDTILSIFNEKGTLLKWLQKLEKAYTGAELTNVEITQTNPLTAIFTFLFEDGSTVNSSSITLPQGPAGKDGVNGTNGADGAPGKDGNGIVSIVSGAPYVSGDKTITPVTIETDESTENLTVEAQNAKDGVNGTNGADGFIQHMAQYNKNSDGSTTILVFKRHNDNTDTTLKKGSYVMIVDQSNYKDSIIGLVPEYIGEDTPFIGNSIEIPVTDFDIANYTLNLRGEQGIAGTDGVGIESITTLGYRPGTGANIGYTETMLKAHMSDNTDKEFSAFAKDGGAGVLKEFGFVELDWQGISIVHYIDKDGIVRIANNSDIIKPALNTPIKITVSPDISLTQLKFLNSNEQPYFDGVEVMYLNNNGTIKTLTLIPSMASVLSITSGNIYLIVTPRVSNNTLGYLKITV